MKSKFVVTPEIRDEAVRIAIAGGDPRNYLTEKGSQNGPSAWTKIRMDLKKNSPEIYAQLPKRIGNAEVPEAPEMPTVKVDGPLRIETPEANRITVAEAPEKPKITQPVCYDGMTVREIEGLFGRYRRTDINGAIYIDFENPDGADILSYTVDQWRKMRAEQANAFRILGVEL